MATLASLTNGLYLILWQLFLGAENKLAATSSSQKSWESQEKKLEMLNQGHTKAFSQLWIIDDIGYDAPTSIHEEEKQ